MIPIPFFQQERPESCVPACVRMILATHGLVYREIEEINFPQEQITIIDPTYLPDGRRTWSLGLFQIGWQLARNQTILVKR